MRTNEVLERFPTLTLSKLQYWKSKGYISAKKTKLHEREISDYPEKEVEKIGLMVQFLQEGFSDQEAYIRAETQLEQRKQKNLFYESPEALDREIASEQKDARLFQLIKNNPVLRLVAETLSDSRIPQRDKKEMEKQIASFVGWLRDKILIKSSNEWPERKNGF